MDDNDNFFLVMEHVPCGSLASHIHKHTRLSENEARSMFFQLMVALRYLHREMHIAHRDLKAENILMDQHMNIRLIDFGLSNSFTDDDPFFSTRCGSPAYVSPEIIRGEPHTAACDIWSAGVLLYVMVVGDLPFTGSNVKILMDQILKTPVSIPSYLSPELQDLLQMLLIKQPSGRIQMAQILGHPWLDPYRKMAVLDQDGDFLSEVRVARGVSSLDPMVVTEMRAQNFDLTELEQEIKDEVCNSRTAAYKMLRRKMTVDNIARWSIVRRSSLSGLIHDAQSVPAQLRRSDPIVLRAKIVIQNASTKYREIIRKNGSGAPPVAPRVSLTKRLLSRTPMPDAPALDVK
jgi:serine/threonine protein kinase